MILRLLRLTIPVASLGALVAMSQPTSQPALTLEAERAERTAVSVATTRAGFTGDGYVYGFTNAAGELVFTFDSPRAGVHDLAIRYACNGGKGYAMTVNGTGYDGFLPGSSGAFATYEAGKIEVAQGVNRISLGKGWGHYEIDAIRLTPSQPYAKPKPVPATLANKNASPEARQLMQRLVDAYGRSTLSGVIAASDVDYVREQTGQTPAIVGGDLMDYTASRLSRGADPKRETERLIAAGRAGHAVTISWHWNAPQDLIDVKDYVTPKGKKIDASWYRGFYSDATTFDFAAALTAPESEAYRLLIADIDAIAVELKKLQAANVPVLWRPLHESDGQWFWWGTRGPGEFNKLWRLVHDRLTRHHKLDHLIWVYTWSDPAWYPGDDVVDIVGIDAYPARVDDRLSAKWREAIGHFDGKKLVALSEFGGVPDVDAMQRLGIWWAYFTTWTGGNGPKKNAKDDLTRIFRSPGTGNLTE